MRRGAREAPVPALRNVLYPYQLPPSAYGVKHRLTPMRIGEVRRKEQFNPWIEQGTL